MVAQAHLSAISAIYACKYKQNFRQFTHNLHNRVPFPTKIDTELNQIYTIAQFNFGATIVKFGRIVLIYRGLCGAFKMWEKCTN